MDALDELFGFAEPKAQQPERGSVPGPAEPAGLPTPNLATADLPCRTQDTVLLEEITDHLAAEAARPDAIESQLLGVHQQESPSGEVRAGPKEDAGPYELSASSQHADIDGAPTPAQKVQAPPSEAPPSGAADSTESAASATPGAASSAFELRSVTESSLDAELASAQPTDARATDSSPADASVSAEPARFAVTAHRSASHAASPAASAPTANAVDLASAPLAAAPRGPQPTDADVPGMGELSHGTADAAGEGRFDGEALAPLDSRVAAQPPTAAIDVSGGGEQGPAEGGWVGVPEFEPLGALFVGEGMEETDMLRRHSSAPPPQVAESADPLDDLATVELALVGPSQASLQGVLEGDRVGAQLDSVVAGLADMCRGVWPAQGRVHPSNPNTMLGGQMRLQMERQTSVEAALASSGASAGGVQITSVGASPVAWDRGRQEEVDHTLVALGLSSGAVLVQVTCHNPADLPTRNPHQHCTFVLEPSRQAAASAPHAPVACVAVSVPNQSCFAGDQPWYLAVADDDPRGTIRVVDLSTVMQMAATPPGPGRPRAPFSPERLAAEAAECCKACATVETGFRMAHLETVYSNNADTLGRAALFLAAAFQPLSLVQTDEPPGLRVLACSRKSTFGLSFSSRFGVTVAMRAVSIDVPSVFTEKWDGTGRTVVRGERLAGPWRTLRAMPPLLAHLNYDVDPGRAHVGGAASPGARGRRTTPGQAPALLPPASRDHMKELLALCALDDVHICRVKSVAAASASAAGMPDLRMTRLFSLNLGNETGNWGAMSSVSWSPRRDPGAKHSFPCHELAKAGVSDGLPATVDLASAELAVSWGSTIHIFQVPCAAVKEHVPSNRHGEERRQKMFLYVHPVKTRTISLSGDATVVHLGWLQPPSEDASVPAQVASASRTLSATSVQASEQDYLMPIVRLFDPTTGEEVEILDTGVAVVGNQAAQSSMQHVHSLLPPTITQHSRRVAAELNARGGADQAQAHFTVDEIVYLPAADCKWLGHRFHVLSGRSLLVLSLDAMTGQLRQLHRATPISWRAQASVLSSVASSSEAALSQSRGSWLEVQDLLGKRAFALFRSCLYWQRLHASGVLSGDRVTPEAVAMVEVVAEQLQALVGSFTSALSCAVPALRHHKTAVYWQHRPQQYEHQQAAIMIQLALLLAADAHRLGGAVDPSTPLVTTLKLIYDALKRTGFAATIILSVETALRNGVVVRLPPDFVDDMIEVCARNDTPRPQGDGRQGQPQLRWVERVLLHLQDAATVDTNALFRICRSQRMWVGLIHCGTLMDDPLLPLPYMLQHACASAPGHDDEAGRRAGYQMLLYMRCCFRGERYPPVAALERRFRPKTADAAAARDHAEEVRLCVLAFMLWTSKPWLERKLGLQHGSHFEARYPVVQAMLQVDATAVMAVARELAAETEAVTSEQMMDALKRRKERDLRLAAPSELLLAPRRVRQLLADAFCDVLLQEGALLYAASRSEQAASGEAPAAVEVSVEACAAVQLLAALTSEAVDGLPPVTLPLAASLACVRVLCRPWPAHAPSAAGRRKLLLLLTTTLALDGAAPSAAELDALLDTMCAAEMFEAAGKLNHRLGRLAPAIGCYLRQCEVVHDVLEEARLCTLDVVTEPADEELIQRSVALVDNMDELLRAPATDNSTLAGSPTFSAVSSRTLSSEVGSLSRSRALERSASYHPMTVVAGALKWSSWALFDKLRVEYDALLDKMFGYVEALFDDAATRRAATGAVLRCLTDLLNVDASRTGRLLLNHLTQDELKRVMRSDEFTDLRALEQLFHFMDGILAGPWRQRQQRRGGEAAAAPLLDASVAARHTSLINDPDVSRRYLELLCCFNPDGVYPFLEASLRPNSGVVGIDAAVALAFAADYNVLDARALLLNNNNQPAAAREVACDFVQDALARLLIHMWHLLLRHRGGGADVDAILAHVVSEAPPGAEDAPGPGRHRRAPSFGLPDAPAPRARSAPGEAPADGARRPRAAHPAWRKDAAARLHGDVQEGVARAGRARRALRCAIGFLTDVDPASGAAAAARDARVAGWVRLLTILLREDAMMCRPPGALASALNTKAMGVDLDDEAARRRRAQLLNATVAHSAASPEAAAGGDSPPSEVDASASSAAVAAVADVAQCAALLATHHRAFLSALINDAVRQMALHVEVDRVMAQLMSASLAGSPGALAALERPEVPMSFAPDVIDVASSRALSTQYDSRAYDEASISDGRWVVHRQMVETALGVLDCQFHLQAALCALLGGATMAEFDAVRSRCTVAFRPDAVAAAAELPDSFDDGAVNWQPAVASSSAPL